MSNSDGRLIHTGLAFQTRPQPTVYRSIIDEVIGSLKPDFDEFGVGEDVLLTLQQKWESRVHASRAADFSDSQASASSNPHAAQYNGIGSVAASGGVSRTGSPNIHRTNSPTIPNSRGASRTNSVGNVTNAYTRTSSSSFSNPPVKAEPIDRSLPAVGNPPSVGGMSRTNHASYNPSLQGLPSISLPPLSNMGAVPPLSSYPQNMNALNAYGANRGVPGYGVPPGGMTDNRNVLMLNRGAAPYGAGAAGSSASQVKMPQVDGTWDEEEGDEEGSVSLRKRQWLVQRYPWMAEARLANVDTSQHATFDIIPQVDGPSSSTPPVPPLNTLPPLNLPPVSSGTGIVRAGGPPPLTLPPLNLPSMNTPPMGNKILHPSLLIKPPPEEDVKPSLGGGSNSSFARNPNVPAQPSEDINSDLDDTDDDEGPQEQPGSDPDADVTYCTYDKVTRVKTRWKVVFRDGMVHANGKDYLFGRCTGEFDW
ncbi:SubName: Full=Related to TOA1-transcription factor TFIIA-L {ECO:0000313/EMBL:CCA70544.1} [Serendipita indica DSM 11827]|uniref:Related to TOA1-transcription factor TFIIA-L n=1 Tax=Serendipita indica (strain DSM 11827) TaxID=1109443 RepID=G4TGV1_SERID|nr:SubName: Full=Related to TOA1-transcription factor TFIIA-L {ECO:0000313/EMBL:CCA70544.1} [Serendipita indica DSM 11827]CCA70544.1 related to TOA1-transcription factor TFIIA-L [Serendipita indica DSM 11827]